MNLKKEKWKPRNKRKPNFCLVYVFCILFIVSLSGNINSIANLLHLKVLAITSIPFYFVTKHPSAWNYSGCATCFAYSFFVMVVLTLPFEKHYTYLVVSFDSSEKKKLIFMCIPAFNDHTFCSRFVHLYCL